MKKSIVSFFIMLIILQMCFPTKVKGDSIRYEYNGEIRYPGFKERIEAIKANHPNWNFVIMETTLDWEDVIANEYTGHHVSPKNLIQGKSGGWICSICGQEIFDTGNWMCASEQAIRYYMDPRNFLIDSPYLFQFLKINYDSTTDEDVYNALNGTFLYSWENASLINRVCRESDANPYFIIARIIQEQGNAGGYTYKMQDTDGTIYYNLFNIGAGGNGDEVYENALKKAKEMGWTSIELCIREGISFLLSSYIGNKQNTIYLNKFDVETYNGVYVKQYMQNIEAPKSEGLSMYNKMKKANLLDKNLTFVIPVYENMPELASSSPEATGELYPKNIRVKEGHSRIVIRAGQSTSTSVIGYINDSSTVILSVERFNDGWHRIILSDETQGFVKYNSNYLEEIDDIVNCREEMTIKERTTLRVGPGAGQTELTSLSAGEKVTRIENSGMYNFGGQIWDRVRISDGRQGFVERRYLESQAIEEGNEVVNEIDTNETNEPNITVTSEPSVNATNEITNNIEENQVLVNETTNEIVSNETISNEIDENEIVTNELATITPEMNSTQSNEITEGNNVQEGNTDDEREVKYLVISPEKQAKDLEGIVTKNGEITEIAGTGSTIEQNGEKYIIIKRGDVNGDGYVKANDYLIIKDYIMDKTTLENEYLKASDVTNDKAVKANDYLKIKDHIMFGINL